MLLFFLGLSAQGLMPPPPPVTLNERGHLVPGGGPGGSGGSSSEASANGDGGGGSPNCGVAATAAAGAAVAAAEAAAAAAAQEVLVYRGIVASILEDERELSRYDSRGRAPDGGVGRIRVSKFPLQGRMIIDYYHSTIIQPNSELLASTLPPVHMAFCTSGP